MWHQCRDTCIDNESSYFARINYTNNNAVHHGIVKRADLYPFCSAPWFALEADPGYRDRVASYKYNRLDIDDEF